MKKTIAIGALILGFLMPHTVLAQNKTEQTAGGLQPSVSVYYDVVEDTLDETEVSDSLYDEERSQADLHSGMATSAYDVLDNAIDAMIPISICVILPLAIVFMVFYFRRKRYQERARLIEKMIDKDMDVSAFIKAEKAGADSGTGKTDKFVKMLAWGLVLLCGGICIVVYQICSNQYLDEEITMLGWIAVGIGLALTTTAFVWHHVIRKDASQVVKGD